MKVNLRAPVSLAIVLLLMISILPDKVFARAVSNQFKASEYWVTLSKDQANSLISDANAGKIEESFVFMYCSSQSDCGLVANGIPDFYKYIHETKTKVYILDVEDTSSKIAISGFTSWLGDAGNFSNFFTPIVLGYNAQTKQRIGIAGGTELHNYVEIIYKTGIPVPGADINGFWLSEGDTTLNAYFGTAEHVIIPDGVTRIADYAFAMPMLGKNDKLKSVIIPDSVISIGRYAFYRSDLHEVTIPASAKDIGGDAFSGCENLIEVCFEGALPAFYGDSFNHNAPGLSFYVPSNDASWDDFTYQYSYLDKIKNDYFSVDLKVTRGLPSPFRHASAWAREYLTTADNAGIVPKSLQSRFTDSITRVEFCALAVALYENVHGEITGRKTFTDTTDINAEKCAYIGVANGTNANGTLFSPNNQLTREQAATMLSRLVDANGSPLLKQAPTFADNSSISPWATAAVGQMQATGIMGGVGNGSFSPKEQYTREQSIVTILRLYNMVT